MWKSLISSGRQAIRANCHSTILPKPTAASRNFVAVPRRYKQPADTRDFDREALNPHRSETTKTGTDDEIAKHDAAFDPHNTSPESELEATEQESKNEGPTGTLNMSGANKKVNAWREPQEGGLIEMLIGKIRAERTPE